MTQSSWGFDTVNDPAGDATNPVSDAQLSDFFRSAIGGGLANAGVFANVEGGLVPDIPIGTTSRIRLQTGRALVNGRPYTSSAVEVLVTVAASQNTRRRVVIEHSLDSTDTNYKQSRLVILNGTDGSLTAPALTQQNAGIWQIPVCAFTVSSGGAISDLTDERVLIGHFAPVPLNSVGSGQLQDNSIQEDHYSDNSIPMAAIQAGAVGTDEVSDDIVRRANGTTWNTVEDLTETAYNNLATPDADTFYTVDR